MKHLENAIAARIYEFDILSLLRILATAGYAAEEIRFISYNSISSQTGLIQSIEFREEPVREAVITMNIGLLAAQSPLPSYFRKKMENDVRGEHAFVEFIGYFDHQLILDYLGQLYPEINRYFYPDWEVTKRRYLQIFNLRSLSGLHWLFQIVFPEIEVQVERAVLGSDVQAQPVRLGKTVLGQDAIFGHKARVPLQGRRITLYTEEEMTDTQVPWPREIQHRLNTLIFPVLRPAGIDMEIYLVLKSQRRWVRLHAETYLGYDRMRSAQEDYRRIRIFKGHVGEAFRTPQEDSGLQPYKKSLTAFGTQLGA